MRRPKRDYTEHFDGLAPGLRDAFDFRCMNTKTSSVKMINRYEKSGRAFSVRYHCCNIGTPDLIRNSCGNCSIMYLTTPLVDPKGYSHALPCMYALWRYKYG